MPITIKTRPVPPKGRPGYAEARAYRAEHGTFMSGFVRCPNCTCGPQSTCPGLSEIGARVWEDNRRKGL